MKIVRRITYEGDEAKLKQQLEGSVPIGCYPWLTTVTIEHVEGPRWETDGKRYSERLKGEAENVQ